LVKQLCGGDKITGRQLYGAAQSFYLYGTMVMLVNEIPKIDASPTDHGSWRRFETIPFESTFSDKPDQTKKHNYAIDPTLDKKLPLWANAFLSLLVQKLKQYGQQAPKTPTKVADMTKTLRYRNDYVGRFKEEILDSDQNSFTSFRNMWKAYVHYCKFVLHMTDRSRGDSDRFRQQMVAILGNCTKNTRKEEGWNVGIKTTVLYNMND
jgi:putative DNA primase/helicase